MLSKFSKYIITIIFTIFITISIVIVLLFFRLQQGPLSVGFLTPYFQEAIQLNPDLDLDVSVEDCVIKWRSFEKGFDISLIGLNLEKEDKEIIAYIPEVFLALKIEKILKLEIQVKSIEVVGPKISVKRISPEKFDLSFGKYEYTEGLGEVFKKLFSTDNLIKNFIKTDQIKVFDADLIFIDRVTDKSWRSFDTDLIITKNKNGIDSVFNFLFDHEGENVPIKISSFYNYTSKIFDVGVGFSNFSSNLVTPFSKKLIPLERLMMPLDGALSLKFNENGVIGNIGFNINSNIEGQIDLSPLVEKNIFLNLVQSSGEIDITNNEILFEDLFLVSKNAKFLAKGKISDVDGASILLDATIYDWNNDDLNRLWSDNILPPVRGWYSKSITGGKITNGDILINLSYGQIKRKELNKDSIKINLDVSGVSVKYLSNFPELINGEGTVKITPKNFNGFLDSGKINDVSIADGNISINLLSPKKWFADVEFVGVGKNDDILNILDRRPLNLSENFIINSDNVKGTSASRVILGFPVRLDLTFDQLNFGAVSNLKDFGIKNIISNIDLSDGLMKLNLTNKGLSVEGVGKLNEIETNIDWKQDFDHIDEIDLKLHGKTNAILIKSLGFNFANYIDGEFQFDINTKLKNNKIIDSNISFDLLESILSIDFIDYLKTKNKKGLLTFAYKKKEDGSNLIKELKYESDDLNIDGEIEFDNNLKVNRIDFSKILSPIHDISVSVRNKRPDGYLVAINGNSLDIENYVTKFLNSDTNFNFPEMKLFLQLQKLQITKNKYLTDSKSELLYNGNEIISLTSTGKLNDEGQVIVKIITKNIKNKYLLIHSKNAGTIAKSTGLFEDAEGGDLLLYAMINNNSDGPLFTGNVILNNIRLIKVPIFTRLLSLASLSGIVEILSGEGLLFVRGNLPFDYGNGVFVSVGGTILTSSDGKSWSDTKPSSYTTQL